MSKKAMVSLLLIGLMAFGAGLGTYAWFTSQATSAGNTFSAGNLVVDLNDNARNETFDLGVIGNMQPGDKTGEAVFEFLNTGSLNLAWFGRFVVEPVDSGSMKLAEAIYIDSAKMEFIKPDGSGTWQPADQFITDGTGSGLYPGDYYAMANDDPLHVISLNTWMTHPRSNAMGVGKGVMTGALKPGYKYKFTFKLGFAPLAGNEYQGDVEGNNGINIKYVVDATQVNADAISHLDAGIDAISVGSPSAMLTWYEAQIAKQN